MAYLDWKRTTVFCMTLLLLAGCVKTRQLPSSEELVRKDSPAPYPISNEKRDELAKTYADLRHQFVEMENSLIAPSVEDMDQFHDFLAQSETGLARLFPRSRSAESSLVVSDGNATYYSFHRRTNDWGYGNDIGLEQYENSPSRFRIVETGFIADLGKIDIKAVTEKTPGVAFALQYEYPKDFDQKAWYAEREKFSNNNGVTHDGFTYRYETASVVGNTYALRSRTASSSPENNADLVVVFQVVRREPIDNSIVIAWRILKSNPLPEEKTN